MATRILGHNSENEFRNNVNRFEMIDDINAFHQTLRPILLTNNAENAEEVQDTFAKEIDGEYTIIEYTGLNLIDVIRDELDRV